MQIKKVCLPLLFLNFLMVVECSIIVSRQNVAGSLKKEPRSKTGKRSVSRGEAFENLFQVYDPSFLAVVWPKISNGVHLLLDVQCWEDIRVFFKDFSDGKAWAYKAVDASGRYPSAFLSGNRFWLGSKEQCLYMNHEFNVTRSNTSEVAPYEDRLTKVTSRIEKNVDNDTHAWRSEVHGEIARNMIISYHPPYSLGYTTVQVAFNITKPGVTEMSEIIIGVCLPQSCDVNDIKSIINFSIMINNNLKSNRTLPRITRIKSLRKIESYDFKRDVGAILLISITMVLIMLGIVATLIEKDLMKCPTFNKKSMSFDVEMLNNTENISIDKDNKVIDGIEGNGIEQLRTNFVSAIDMATNLKTVNKCNAVPLPITPEVVFADQQNTGCRKCGKFKKQCSNARVISYLSSFPREKESSAESVATEETSSLFYRLLLCFSLIYSWKRIFNKNTANKDLFMIHILKIIATFWVIFVHVSVMVDHVSDNAKDMNEHNNVYYILLSGTVAFDTLFFVSGLFSSHHFFYLKSRYSVEQLVSFGGTCGQILQFICFVTNRVIRMLPSYAYAILLTAVLARVARDTAVLTLPDGDHRNCDAFWWRNILYISNIYPDNEQCMQVSWYLSLETQLHAAGALACAASVSAHMFDNKRASLVAALALVVLLAATAVDVSLSYIDDGLLFTNAYAAYSAIIVRPWARVAPYFMGVFAGWLVHAMEGRLKVSKITSCILWVLSMSLMATCAWAWGAQGAGAGMGAGAWVHVSWPAAILWPLLASCCVRVRLPGTSRASGRVGLGGALSALSRLCGGMLVVHAAAAKLVILSADTALCSRTICIWSYFAGTSLLTVLASLLLSLLLETPCCSLLRRISDYATT